MKEDNIIKKKKKNNNYRYHRNHNQNRYYYKNKNNKKKNLITDNNDTGEIKNILLFNEQKAMPKEEVNETIQVINENIPDYEEIAVVPKKQLKKRINLMNKNVLKYGVGILVLIVAILGTSYSVFNYTMVDSRQADISTGEIYVRLMENMQNITLSKMYPRTNEEARSRNDNYFDFTIKGKNTSPTKAVLYSFSITNGEDVTGKTRINPEYISIDLQEKVNNNYVYIKEGVSLNSFSFIGIIPTNTTNEITKEYRLRIWINDSIIISDTETNASYTQAEFNNLFANFNVSIESEDKEMAYSMFAKNVDTETTINFGNDSSSTNGEGLYILLGTESSTFPIYYYRGEIDNNNVVFGDYCWKIVRTTDTGGIKMIYNGPVTGTSEVPTCENTVPANTVISTSGISSDGMSMSDVGYMYNTRYQGATGKTTGAIYGRDVEWNGSNYLVIDSTANTPSTQTSLGDNYHYSCGTNGGTTCSTVRFYYYSENSDYQYISLTNGDTIEDAVYKMIGYGDTATKNRNSGYVLNKNDSTVKIAIESWFRTNLTNEVDNTKINYVDYLEDTIYCNDRSTFSTGNASYPYSGWSKTGGLTNSLVFATRERAFNNNWYSTTNIPSMTCPNETDRFSVASRVAHLNYPVGLLTFDEIILAGSGGNTSSSNDFYLASGVQWWSSSPYAAPRKFYGYYFLLDSNGISGNLSLSGASGLRPVVSLKLGIMFEPGGNGTPTNPYVVKYN